MDGCKLGWWVEGANRDHLTSTERRIKNSDKSLSHQHGAHQFHEVTRQECSI